MYSSSGENPEISANSLGRSSGKSPKNSPAKAGSIRRARSQPLSSVLEGEVTFVDDTFIIPLFYELAGSLSEESGDP
jgi:hypothetical protein